MYEAHDRVPERAPELEHAFNARAVRRFAALSSDARSAAPADESQFWRRACRGELSLIDTFFEGERCYALWRARVGRSLSPRRRQILERILLGARPKVVAIELRVSPSSVSGAVAQSLRYLGFDDRGTGVPLVLVLAARAAATGQHFDARQSRFELEGVEFLVLSARRPDLSIATVLSPAELEVLASLVEGRSHGEISELRGTSRRTVANQLGSAYRKLGVSGRMELIDELVRRAPCAGAQ
ncbi:MAG: response regulator transcription factor [Myxococcota bacterium]